MFDLNSAENKRFAIACGGARLETMQVISMSDPHRVISPWPDSLVEVRHLENLIQYSDLGSLAESSESDLRAYLRELGDMSHRFADKMLAGK